MAPLKSPQNFKFDLFFSTSVVHDFVTNHTPIESPNISTNLAPSSLSPTSLVVMKGKSFLVFESTPTFKSIDHMLDPRSNEPKKEAKKIEMGNKQSFSRLMGN